MTAEGGGGGGEGGSSVSGRYLLSLLGTRPFLVPFTLPRDGRDSIIIMGGGSRRRSKRGLFWYLLCAVRGPGPLLPTRDDALPCGGCIIPAHDPYVAREAASPGTSLVKMNSTGGDGIGDAHKHEQSLLSFAVYKMSCHLCHVDAKRA